MKEYTPYAVARFDGALMYNEIRAGLMKTGITKSPIVLFRVRAGIQLHPVWALDDLAMKVYTYCETARTADVSENHLQVSVTASWISGETCSNLFASFIEWHIASSELRIKAKDAYRRLRDGKRNSWPTIELKLPV